MNVTAVEINGLRCVKLDVWGPPGERAEVLLTANECFEVAHAFHTAAGFTIGGDSLKITPLERE